jgi:hypothetical protein
MADGGIDDQLVHFFLPDFLLARQEISRTVTGGKSGVPAVGRLFLGVEELYTQSLAKDRSGSLHRRKSNTGISRIEQTIEGGSAGSHLPRHLCLAQTSPLHCLRQLPGQDLLLGNGAGIFQHTFLSKEAVERRPNMSILGHSPSSSIRLRLSASAMSLFEVRCVFFMKPCSKIIRFP